MNLHYTHLYEVDALYDQMYGRPESFKVLEAKNYVEAVVAHYTKKGIVPESLSILELLAGRGRHEKYVREALNGIWPDTKVTYRTVEGLEAETSNKRKVSDPIMVDDDTTYDVILAFYYSVNSVLDLDTLKTGFGATKDLFNAAYHQLSDTGVALLDVSVNSDSSTMEEVFDNDVTTYHEVPFGSTLHSLLGRRPSEKLILHYGSVTSYDRLDSRLSTKHYDIVVYAFPANIERDDYWEPWCYQTDISRYAIADIFVKSPFTLNYYTENALACVLSMSDVPKSCIQFLDMGTDTVEVSHQPMKFTTLGQDVDGDEIDDDREYSDYTPTCVQITKS